MAAETIIYPRSPRETMSGWIYLPRFVDKIRLHLAGKLHPDYQGNLGKKGFDLAWLNAAGLDADTFIAVVKETTTDGEVADWVAKNVKRSDAEKAAFRDQALNHGRQNDESLRALLRTRKEQAGFGAREDIQTFFEFIDADEKRT